MDGLDDKRFQAHAALLAICKVNKSPLDVQWNGWLFDYLLSKHYAILIDNEPAKLIAEERLI